MVRGRSFEAAGRRVGLGDADKRIDKYVIDADQRIPAVPGLLGAPFFAFFLRVLQVTAHLAVDAGARRRVEITADNQRAAALDFFDPAGAEKIGLRQALPRPDAQM